MASMASVSSSRLIITAVSLEGLFQLFAHLQRTELCIFLFVIFSFIGIFINYHSIVPDMPVREKKNLHQLLLYSASSPPSNFISVGPSGLQSHTESTGIKGINRQSLSLKTEIQSPSHLQENYPACSRANGIFSAHNTTWIQCRDIIRSNSP